MIKYYYSKQDRAGGWLYKLEDGIFYELEFHYTEGEERKFIKIKNPPDDLIECTAQEYLKMSIKENDDNEWEHFYYHNAIRKIIKNEFYKEVLKELE